MSTTKWMKLMRIAAALSTKVPRMNYKLVHGPEIHRGHTPLCAESVEAEWFAEPLIYKEVEWVEFPFEYEIPRGSGLAPSMQRQDITSLKHQLENAADFPLQETDTGLRVVAYVPA